LFKKNNNCSVLGVSVCSVYLPASCLFVGQSACCLNFIYAVSYLPPYCLAFAFGLCLLISNYRMYRLPAASLPSTCLMPEAANCLSSCLCVCACHFSSVCLPLTGYILPSPALQALMSSFCFLSKAACLS
jgi:hypothetical protein